MSKITDRGYLKECVKGAIGVLDVSGAIESLRNGTDNDAALPPDDDQGLLELWGRHAAQELIAARLPHLAAHVAIALYDHLCGLQDRDDRRYHKGTPAQQAAIAFRAAGSRAAALWYHRLAFVEDALEGREASHAAFDLRLLDGERDEVLAHLAGWAEQFPPDDVRRRHPEGALVSLAASELATPSSTIAGTSDLPVNPSYARSFRHALENDGPHGRGQAFEDLIAYLLLTLPGVRLRRNVRALDAESDVIVTIATAGSSYMVDAFGRAFVVECKYRQDPVDVAAINHFIAKLRFFKCCAGVLFSRSGVTGHHMVNRGVSAARLTQLRWFHQDGCAVVVIDQHDLQALIEAKSKLSDLLLCKYEDLRFSVPDNEPP